MMTYKQLLLSVTVVLYLRATNTHRQQSPYSSASVNTKLPTPKQQQQQKRLLLYTVAYQTKSK